MPAIDIRIQTHQFTAETKMVLRPETGKIEVDGVEIDGPVSLGVWPVTVVKGHVTSKSPLTVEK